MTGGGDDKVSGFPRVGRSFERARVQYVVCCVRLRKDGGLEMVQCSRLYHVEIAAQYNGKVKVAVEYFDPPGQTPGRNMGPDKGKIRRRQLPFGGWGVVEFEGANILIFTSR